MKIPCYIRTITGIIRGKIKHRQILKCKKKLSVSVQILDIFDISRVKIDQINCFLLIPVMIETALGFSACSRLISRHERFDPRKLDNCDSIIFRGWDTGKNFRDEFESPLKSGGVRGIFLIF